uniref:Putative secreted protein n=1 Tax=Ixodes ricinus TaxID=34613 RepID=A0A6B0UR19_IXORI
MSVFSMIWTWSKVTAPLILSSSVGRRATASWSSGVVSFRCFVFSFLCNLGPSHCSNGFVTLPSVTKVVGVPSRLGILALSETGEAKRLAGLSTSSGTYVMSSFSMIWAWSEMTDPLILSSSVGRGATASW